MQTTSAAERWQGGQSTQLGGTHGLSWEIKHHWPKVEPGDFKSGFVVKQGRGGPRLMEVDPRPQNMGPVQDPLGLQWMQSRIEIQKTTNRDLLYLHDL